MNKNANPYPIRTIALAATLALAGSLMLTAIADPLFAGVTRIEAKPGPTANDQVIRLDADLPFQYSITPINRDQVAITLKNARLSDNLVNNNGLLNITPGGAVSVGAIGSTDDVTQEQIVLSGPGLGGKHITVEGPGIRQNVAQSAALDTEPAVNMMATAATSTRTAMTLPDKPSWYKPDPHKYDPEPNRSHIGQADRRGFLGLFEQKTTSNPTVASTTPSRLSFFTVVKNNRPQTDFQAEQAMMERTRTPAAKERPLPAPPAYSAPAQQQQQNDEPTNVLAVASPAATGNPNVAMPKRIDIDSTATDFRMNAGSATPSISTPVTPAAQKHAGPQIQSVSTMPYAGVPQRPVTPWGDPSFAAPAQPIYTQPQAPQQAAVNPVSDDEEDTDAAVAEASAPQPAENNSLKALPRYQGGSPPIQFTVSGYGTTPGKVYTLPQGSTGPNVAAFGNGQDSAVAALAYSDSREQVNALMRKSLAAFKSGDYPLALSTVNEALKLDDKNAELYAALAEIDLKQNRYEDAETAYGKAVDLDARKINPRYAQIMILAGNRAKAMSTLKAMAGNKAFSSSDLAKVHYMLGTLYQQQGEMYEAVGHLQAAARLAPKNADIQYNLGLAYEFSGDLQQAKAHYAQAVRLNPQAPDARKALARTEGSLRKS